MSVDFEAEGLLDDLPDPRERAERMVLLHHLLHRGVPLEDLCRAAAPRPRHASGGSGLCGEC